MLEDLQKIKQIQEDPYKLIKEDFIRNKSTMSETELKDQLL